MAYLQTKDMIWDPSPNYTRIYSVCIEATNRCNGRCIYCLQELHALDVNKDRFIKYINILHENGIERVGWSGGEPLLNKDIYELGKYSRHLGLGSLLRTSGAYLFNQSELSSAFDWIDISLDSTDERVFNANRPGIPLQIVKLNIVNTLATFNRLRVNVILTKKSCQTLDDTVEWLCKHGVKYIRLHNIIPRGRAKRLYSTLKISDYKFRRIFAQVTKDTKPYGVLISKVESLETTSLVILKPNGLLYIGHKNRLELIGEIEDKITFSKASHIVSRNQLGVYASA